MKIGDVVTINDNQYTVTGLVETNPHVIYLNGKMFYTCYIDSVNGVPVEHTQFQIKQRKFLSSIKG